MTATTALLKNAWYMAGWAEELGANGFVREIMGRRTYFYRLESGDPAAILAGDAVGAGV